MKCESYSVDGIQGSNQPAMGTLVSTPTNIDRLTALIEKVPSVLKWKICHMKELDTWCKVSQPISTYLDKSPAHINRDASLSSVTHATPVSHIKPKAPPWP